MASILIRFLPGSHVTPTYDAMTSPKDLAIASPGIFSSCNQTLYGPTGLRFSSKYVSTLPPLLMILSYSSGSSGL